MHDILKHNLLKFFRHFIVGFRANEILDGLIMSDQMDNSV